MSDTQQGTDAWMRERAGKVTASRIGDLMARTKTGYGASRANYLAELLVERLTGQKTERFQSAEMRWGIETEPQARAAYSFHTDNDVQATGFIGHPRIPMSGASPDGLVGDAGMLEIKCPNTATHVETLLAGSIAERYFLQMQWQIACAQRQWCDFVSFDPRMPVEMQLYVERIPRDDACIGALEKEVAKFLAELDAKHHALLAKFERAAA